MSEFASALVAVVGAVLGSFIATAALRFARGEQAVLGRSHCDACQQPLSALHTLPVISFVALRGACAGCGARIEVTHLLGEIAAAVSALVVFRIAVFPVTLCLAVLGGALLATSIVDHRTRKLPDALTLLIAAAGLLIALNHGWEAVREGVFAAAIVLAVLVLLRRGFQALGRDPSLGFGDVKLIVALSIWLGAATPLMVAAAAGLGIVMLRVTKPEDGRIPFGPMIALSGWSVGLLLESGLWRG